MTANVNAMTDSQAKNVMNTQHTHTHNAQVTWPKKQGKQIKRTTQKNKYMNNFFCVLLSHIFFLYSFWVSSVKKKCIFFALVAQKLFSFLCVLCLIIIIACYYCTFVILHMCVECKQMKLSSCTTATTKSSVRRLQCALRESVCVGVCACVCVKFGNIATNISNMACAHTYTHISERL